METLRQFQLQRTLSIESCFPETNSTPASGSGEEQELSNNGITSHHVVSVQLTYSSSGMMTAPKKKIQSQTSMHTVPGTTQAHLSSVSEGVGKYSFYRKILYFDV